VSVLKYFLKQVGSSIVNACSVRVLNNIYFANKITL
jgi:hypothetical protein